MSKWQRARVGLAVCALGLSLGFLLGALGLPGWAGIAAGIVVAFCVAPVLARWLIKRHGHVP